MDVHLYFLALLCFAFYLVYAFGIEQDVPLPIPVIEDNDNYSLFSTLPLPSMPLSSSISSIFPTGESSWQLPSLDQMLTQRSFFGLPPLLPFGMEITSPKSLENIENNGLLENEKNETLGRDERFENGFSPSKQAGIKIRFNPPTFDNVAHYFHDIFSEEAKRLQIPAQKQCFQEGCFRLHTFQIVNFQKPETFTLKPLGPNLLLLNIAGFDLNIESMVSGNIQFLLFTPMPVSGNFYAEAQELSIKALLGLQKDGKKVPSLRMVSCEMVEGIINTKVTDLGLFTDSINLKYKDEILAKARTLIVNTICNTIFKTIRDRVNRVLHKLPFFMSVENIFVSLFGRLDKKNECVQHCYDVSTKTLNDTNTDKFLDFLDLNSLKRVLINLEFFDSSAGENYFSVGLLGDAIILKENIIKTNDQASQKFNDNDLLFNSKNNDENSIIEIDNYFNDNLQNDSFINNSFVNDLKNEGNMDIIFNDKIVNNIILKAFRASLLNIYVRSNSLLFGSLLRTSCDLDNVCLGDTIPEANEIYPNEQLELKILPTESPKINFTKDLAILSLSGVGIFFLARDNFNGKPIAKIPFFTIIELNIKNDDKVSLTIPKLEILDNFDFFQISSKILKEGFCDSIRNTIINFASKFINKSTDFLKILELKLCHWGILNPNIKLLNDGLIILNIKELDIFTLFKICD